ncbi:MAG: hemolysin III family protein [Phycisphaerales bacterium]|nr:hemolysin III family protein [Phycisphaerales bacterium]
MILNVQKPVLQHAETISEQRLNCLTHALGALLSLAGLIVMVCLSAINGSVRQIVTVSLFGAALLLVYVASTIYHACPVGPIKQRLQILDHCAIYFLIAGTYTPFLLVSVGGGWGWSLSGALWGLALIGVAFKLLYTGRFDLISSLIYIAMGWSGLIAIQPLLQNLPGGAVSWIFAGGIAYTAGVIFYLWDRLPFNHAIWHLFVLAGSVCHFLAVLFYVVLI